MQNDRRCNAAHNAQLPEALPARAAPSEGSNLARAGVLEFLWTLASSGAAAV
jgi:hypothetical protein